MRNTSAFEADMLLTIIPVQVIRISSTLTNNRFIFYCNCILEPSKWKEIHKIKDELVYQ
jgi:hypothetical protein